MARARVTAEVIENLRRLIVDEGVPLYTAAEMLELSVSTAQRIAKSHDWPTLRRDRPEKYQTATFFGLKPDAKPLDPSYADMCARERLEWGNDRYVRALLKEGVARGLIRVTPSDRVAA